MVYMTEIVHCMHLKSGEARDAYRGRCLDVSRDVCLLQALNAVEMLVIKWKQRQESILEGRLRELRVVKQEQQKMHTAQVDNLEKQLEFWQQQAADWKRNSRMQEVRARQAQVRRRAIADCGCPQLKDP
jgi:hypothetical protein